MEVASYNFADEKSIILETYVSRYRALKQRFFKTFFFSLQIPPNLGTSEHVRCAQEALQQKFQHLSKF